MDEPGRYALRETSYRRIRQLATGERVTLVDADAPRELIADPDACTL